MNEADGDYRRMTWHKGGFSPQLFSTYTPMISQSMMEQGASSMQMTCVSQPSSIPSHKLESTIEEALGELQYYRNNSLRANPDKTQVTAFHLRNRDAEIIENIMERS